MEKHKVRSCKLSKMFKRRLVKFSLKSQGNVAESIVVHLQNRISKHNTATERDIKGANVRFQTSSAGNWKPVFV